MRLLAFRKRLMNYREMREELGMKRSMRFAAVMMAAVMTVGTASTAMAAEWKHDSKGWWWQNDDGSYPAASWQWQLLSRPRYRLLMITVVHMLIRGVMERLQLT